jgi:hypothetical protein
MLGPAYDAAFDAGLITFADDGGIVISRLLPGSQLAAAGISANAVVPTLLDQHRRYLAHHRENVFVPA